MIKKIYAIYDKDGQIVFVGTREECLEFLGCKVNAFYRALREKSCMNTKYYIYYVFEEDVQPRLKRCKGCGKIKPIEDFYFMKSRNGYSTKCKLCKSEENKRYGRSKNIISK